MVGFRRLPSAKMSPFLFEIKKIITKLIRQRLTSPHEFFTRRVEDFVTFIHLSCVGFKPPSDLNVPFDPGGLPL